PANFIVLSLDNTNIRRRLRAPYAFKHAPNIRVPAATPSDAVLRPEHSLQERRTGARVASLRARFECRFDGIAFSMTGGLFLAAFPDLPRGPGRRCHRGLVALAT